MRFRIIVITGLVVVLCAGALILAHWKLPSHRDTIEFSAAALGALLAIVAALYGAETLLASARQARRSRSLQIIDQLNLYDAIQLRLKLEKELRDFPEDERAKAVRENLQTYSRALLLLGVFEDIALTIRWNVADEWILYDSLGFVIPYYYRLLKPLIEALRREHGDQSLYERIEHLVECWQKQISVRTSKPLEEPSV